MIILLSFDPTPKLKYSPIPIKFISFNQDNDKCFIVEICIPKHFYLNKNVCYNMST